MARPFKSLQVGYRYANGVGFQLQKIQVAYNVGLSNVQFCISLCLLQWHLSLPFSVPNSSLASILIPAGQSFTAKVSVIWLIFNVFPERAGKNTFAPCAHIHLNHIETSLDYETLGIGKATAQSG